MIKYIMILVFGLSLFLPVVVQAGITSPSPPTVAIIQCNADSDDVVGIVVDATSANDELPEACSESLEGPADCASCIQALLDLGLDLRQIDVPQQNTSWYHFFDNDKRDFDR